MTRIAPSFLPSADLAKLAEEAARVQPGVDMLHVDVMDGHFVPNITVGPPVVKALRQHSDMYFDCHLMISEPAKYLEAFRDAGANSCSVHFEVGDTAELISQMRELKLNVGLGINPDTPFEAFEEHLDKIDMLLVMTVVPGFGGQKFMADVMPKLRRVREVADQRGLQLSIEVDGGIDVNTAPIAAENGADTFVAGSAVFGHADPLEAAARLRDAIEAVRNRRS